MSENTAPRTGGTTANTALGESDRRRVLVAGASGYIGRVLVSELCERGYDVTAQCRRPVDGKSREGLAALEREFSPARLWTVDLLGDDPLAEAGRENTRFDAVFSCLGSRGGGIADAWRVERDMNLKLLAAARKAGAGHFVLLSAICVQKPLLAFQQAKLAFEHALAETDLTWTIVRPTAYFKSLAGQVERVRSGKPFLVFGDGRLTACKPIGECDLARYLADCLDEPSRFNAVLPIGGPGPALTPMDQGRLLFEALGRTTRYRHVPVAMFDVAIRLLDAASRVTPRFTDKAEFARIGRYYATESMLVWDGARGTYDADATPAYGRETLADFYRRVAAEGLARQRLGEHAFFDRRSR